MTAPTGTKKRRGALGRVWAGYRLETLKAARSRRTFIGPLLAALGVVGVLLLHPVSSDAPTDYAFLAKANPLVLDLLGWLLVVTYCASLVSGELGSGSARTILVRPILRHEFLVAKVLHGITYAFALLVIVGAVSWLVVLVSGTPTASTAGGEVVCTGTEALLAYLGAAALAFAPQCATVTYAVMISSFTRSTGTAVTCAVGIWLVVDFLKYPLRIAPFLFTSYLEQPWQVFAGRCDGFVDPWTPMAYHALITSCVACVVFTAVAAISLRRRNFQA